MCGIWAAITPDAVIGRSYSEAAHRAMLSRGPDSWGEVFDERGVHLGMNRLRIWGEETSLPLKLEGFQFAFNGEIYGSLDSTMRCAVRNRAGGEGEMAFWAGSEGEIIDGMYSVMAFCSNTGELYVERDRFGIKPCYYTSPRPGTVLISSDSEFLARYLGTGVNAEAMCETFALGFPLPGKSLFDFVEEVPAATRMTWCQDGARHSMSRRTNPERFGDASELRALVKEAVSRCATCDTTLGLAVSGGLDSTIIAHVLSELSVENIHTFSVINGEDGITDLGQIGLTGRGAHSTWTHHVIDFSALDLAHMFESAITSYPFPTNMSSILLYEALAQEVEAAGLRVLIVGEGVDEIFLGYDNYQQVRTTTSPRPFYLGSRAPWLEKIWGRSAIDSVFQRVVEIYGEEAGLDMIRRIEVRSRLEKLLHRTDVITMAHSIEARTPFPHCGIPERTLAEPAERVRGVGGKELLREAFPSVARALRGTLKRRFKLNERKMVKLFDSSEFRERYYSGNMLPRAEKGSLVREFQTTSDSKTAELILSIATSEACLAR